MLHNPLSSKCRSTSLTYTSSSPSRATERRVTANAPLAVRRFRKSQGVGAVVVVVDMHCLMSRSRDFKFPAVVKIQNRLNSTLRSSPLCVIIPTRCFSPSKCCTKSLSMRSGVVSVESLVWILFPEASEISIESLVWILGFSEVDVASFRSSIRFLGCPKAGVVTVESLIQMSRSR